MKDLLKPRAPSAPAWEEDSTAEFHLGLRTLLDRAVLDQDTLAPPASHAPTTLPGSLALPPEPGAQGGVIPSIHQLKNLIQQDLEQNLSKLLSLNMSRREAIAQYLDRLAGLPPSPAQPGTAEAASALRRWIEGPRSPAQDSALRTYFEEIALIVLGQALLLKAWSDRGVRRWSEADLKDINWAMNTVLKPHLPLDRESWQVARQNIYSWYKPGQQLQRQIWEVLETWRLPTEGPEFLAKVFSRTRQFRPEGHEPQGYDSRFFKAVWEHMPTFGFDPSASTGPLKRNWVLFSPTLRDGSMVQAGPVSVNWIGLENSAFQLMTAELMQLWWGLSAPPLWAIGTGLEVHSRDQLMLGLNSPKPSLVSRIADMEACDAAFLLEERSIRAQGRSADTARFREQLDGLPYFKKLRSPGTTLGDLQACVALTKLRPGGLLWWSREEPLTSTDGAEMLSFLLERGRLICEWDFSEVSHTLPAKRPLFPRYLYLVARENRMEERIDHRPLRVKIQGQIRSHVEMPVLLQDAFQSLDFENTTEHRSPQARGPWKLHVLLSPTTQREWAERWPDPACQNTLAVIEHLRNASLPLANATMIRPTPEGDANRDGAWAVHPSVRGFWVQAVNESGVRRLAAHPLPRPTKEAKGSGFLILVPDETWIAPLSHYLESEAVRSYIEHYAERRGERWILSEQLMRFIPVPKSLHKALGDGVGANAGSDAPFALPLPGEWERIAAELSVRPALVREALQQLPDPQDMPESLEILAGIFVRATRTLESLRSSRGPLLSLVSDQGKIRWCSLLGILPKHECIPVTTHPLISISGNLPLHVAIGQVNPVKTPQPGLLLTTEAGFNLRITSENPLLIEMVADQLEGLVSPTWNELAQYLKLPRRMEIAETTASDVLRSHGEETRRLQELSDLIASCKLF